MPTFYLDYENGNDSTTNTPLGWWSVAFNNGSGNAPTVDDACTGATSGHHGHLTVVGTLSGGSWAGNDAAGVLYFYGVDDLFHNGEQIDWHDGHCHATADAIYCAWKTITLGATAARIAPADIIRIAKSSVPYSIGNATWTNLSKTVTLAGAQTINICTCEADWTPVNATNSAKLAVATDAKEGSYCVKITEDATPANGEVQAYFATGALDLSTKQDISFWIKNEVAITAGMLVLNLYTTADASGAATHSFAIPAIPSTGRWLPLTIASGGNLNAGINSVAIANGAAATYTASKYIYIDNIIACATGGLNLQSLISKNTLEQGSSSGTGYANEGWYGIQSINGTTVLLDNDTNTKANIGKGYSTTGTSPETVATYARETIKTELASVSGTIVQEIMDSGTFAVGNIQFQGGYNTATNEQTGETFYDGLNGNGYCLYLNSKQYVTFNYINCSRYNYGIYLVSSNLNTLTNINNLNNNSIGIYFNTAYLNTMTTLVNSNNNSSYGVYLSYAYQTMITTISNANNNLSYGINLYGNNNTIVTISNANNNANGLYKQYCYGNKIGSINTSGNSSSSIYHAYSKSFIKNATIAETAKFTGTDNYGNSRLQVTYLASTGYSYIYTDFGNIQSQAATGGGSGIEWKLSPTNILRNSIHPLDLDIAKIAVNASALVTVKAYFKKSHATDIGAKLAVLGGQLAGVSETTTTCPDDTNRNELTITFTPSEAGVLIIQAWAYWVANTADENVLIDDITISQA